MIDVVDYKQLELESFAQAVYKSLDLNRYRGICVIGVAEGGLPISEYIANYLKTQELEVSKTSIKCSRPSSKIKKDSFWSKYLKSMLKKLPKTVLNYLRVVEHYLLKYKKNTKRAVSYYNFIDFSLDTLILVVDDAVDSGYSLKEVVSYLESKYPKNIIKTVAVVVTHECPVYKPDFFDIKNKLVRFPWAIDG